MVGISHRDLVVGPRAGARPAALQRALAAAADMIAPVLADVADIADHERQAPAGPPAPRVPGRVFSRAAAGLRRQGTSPVKPDPTKACRSCRL